MRFQALRLATLAALACCLAAPVARAQPGVELSDEAKLSRGVGLFESGRYAECVTEFRRLLGPGSTELDEPDVIERARIYFAACLMAAGKEKDADDQFREAIRESPQMRGPDRLMFPQEVIDRFLQVRDSMLTEIKKSEEERLRQARAAAEAAAQRRARERDRVARLERLASEETVVTQNRRFIAAIPFGVGQFQNGDTALGYLFLGTEVALAGTALGAMIVQLNLNARIDDADAPVTDELNANLKTAQDVLLFSSWGFLAVAAAGIVEAQLSFQPQVTSTRPRALPRELRPASSRASEAFVRPGVLPAPGGLGLGVFGRF